MGKKRKEKVRETIQIDGLLSDPHLMEVEVKYTRDVGIEVKTLMDSSKEGEPLRVVHKGFSEGKLIYEKVYEVLYSESEGTGPAASKFDSIKLGEQVLDHIVDVELLK